MLSYPRSAEWVAVKVWRLIMLVCTILVTKPAAFTVQYVTLISAWAKCPLKTRRHRILISGIAQEENITILIDRGTLQFGKPSPKPPRILGRTGVTALCRPIYSSESRVHRSDYWPKGPETRCSVGSDDLGNVTVEPRNKGCRSLRWRCVMMHTFGNGCRAVLSSRAHPATIHP